MIDIFNIIKTNKTKRINIKGSISESDIIPFTIGDLDVLVDMISRIDDSKIEIKKLKVDVFDESNLSNNSFVVPGPGLIGHSYRVIKTKEFEIDILITEEVYDHIYNAFEDFIDYYSAGVLVSKLKGPEQSWLESTITIDSSSLHNYNLYSNEDRSFGISLAESWLDDSEPGWQMGSYRVNTDNFRGGRLS